MRARVRTTRIRHAKHERLLVVVANSVFRQVLDFEDTCLVYRP